MTMRLIDPTGTVRKKSDIHPRAPRPPNGLQGLNLGILLNEEGSQLVTNWDAISQQLLTQLSEAYGINYVIREVKPILSQPAPEEILVRLTDASDVVINGIGKCGSCTSSTVLDSVTLERRGLPTVTVVTAMFEIVARAQAKRQGMPDLAIAVLPDKAGWQNEVEIAELAQLLLPQVLDGLSVTEVAALAR